MSYRSIYVEGNGQGAVREWPVIHDREYSQVLTGEADACGCQLDLLGGFQLRVDGQGVAVGQSGKRLLALLGVLGRPLSRAEAAGILWPDVSPGRSIANLRSVVWRLRRSACSAAVECSESDLRLADDVAVDFSVAMALAHKLMDRWLPMTQADVRAAVRSKLTHELLPEGPDDEWLALEREQFRHLRLHALEGLVERLVRLGWHGEAVRTALAVVRADPFRESAQAALIKAYNAEGNRRQAVKQYQGYWKLIRDELGVAPSPRLQRLLWKQESPSLTVPEPNSA